MDRGQGLTCLCISQLSFAETLGKWSSRYLGGCPVLCNGVSPRLQSECIGKPFQCLEISGTQVGTSCKANVSYMFYLYDSGRERLSCLGKVNESVIYVDGGNRSFCCKYHRSSASRKVIFSWRFCAYSYSNFDLAPKSIAVFSFQ